MKTLYLVRHAKSSWDQPGVRDFDRTLMAIGKKRTKTVIAFLQSNKVSIDLMISSPAVRAFETAKLIAAGINYPVHTIQKEMMIYGGEMDLILHAIYTAPDEFSSLMLVGHNPAMSHLANHFLKPGIEILPTTGVVAISFKTNHWEKIHEAEVNLEFFVFPKMLKHE
jgi:phosphohistidine phosphatase